MVMIYHGFFIRKKITKTTNPRKIIIHRLLKLDMLEDDPFFWGFAIFSGAKNASFTEGKIPRKTEMMMENSKHLS